MGLAREKTLVSVVISGSISVVSCSGRKDESGSGPPYRHLDNDHDHMGHQKFMGRINIETTDTMRFSNMGCHFLMGHMDINLSSRSEQSKGKLPPVGLIPEQNSSSLGGNSCQWGHLWKCLCSRLFWKKGRIRLQPTLQTP